MNISSPFVHRPVATTLLIVAIALAGAVAFRILPVSPLPQVDFPTISVAASLPGASPETMASSVATPLERQFGHIAAVTEMTSSSALGSTSITLQFSLNRDIDSAARDVQAAINAARGNLPSNLPNNPSYRKVNPADSPIFMLALTSAVLTRGQMYDSASTIMAQKLAQVTGVGQVVVGGSSLPSVRVELNPTALKAVGSGYSLLPARRKHHRYRGPRPGCAPADSILHSAFDRREGGHGSNRHDPRLRPRHGEDPDDLGNPGDSGGFRFSQEREDGLD